jgi:hypothetical protein
MQSPPEKNPEEKAVPAGNCTKWSEWFPFNSKTSGQLRHFCNFITLLLNRETGRAGVLARLIGLKLVYWM